MRFYLFRGCSLPVRLIYPHRKVQTRTVAEQLAVVGVVEEGLVNHTFEVAELAEREAQLRARADHTRVLLLQDELEELEREDAMPVSQEVAGRGLALRVTYLAMGIQLP